MKVQDLRELLQGVPDLLREAAQQLREGQAARAELAKTAAKKQLLASLSTPDSRTLDDDDEVEEELNTLGGKALEKLALRSARRRSLGESSDETAESAGSGSHDREMLEGLRRIG